MIQRATSVAVVLAGALLTAATTTVVAGDNIDGLPPEDRAYADRYLEFLERVDEIAFGRSGDLNGSDASDSLTMKTDRADYDIRIARGPVVEKIGRTRTTSYKTSRPFEQPSIWGRYFLIDIHPKSPLVGMLHAAIVVQFHTDGNSTIAGFLDVLKTAHHDEDLTYMREAMDEVFARHNVDASPYRDLAKEGHEEGDPLRMDNSKRRKTEQIAGSFYGSPLRTVNEENFLFLTDAYETMLTVYMDVVERRAETPHTEEDLLAQDRMRKNWLEDRFFGDPYTSTVTPYDAWSLYSLPPDVKF